MADNRVNGQCMGCKDPCRDEEWGDRICSSWSYEVGYKRHQLCDIAAEEMGVNIHASQCKFTSPDAKTDYCSACGYEFVYP